jgi:hypothetical protein
VMELGHASYRSRGGETYTHSFQSFGIEDYEGPPPRPPVRCRGFNDSIQHLRSIFSMTCEYGQVPTTFVPYMALASHLPSLGPALECS